MERMGFERGTCRMAAAAVRGFSLIEVMTATVILLVILVVIFAITQQISSAWTGSAARIEAFQGARAAFEAMTHELEQAALNPYYDYDNVAAPTRYLRKSDLHFITGKALVGGQVTHAAFFQAPLGKTDDPRFETMDTLLNACGFLVTFGDDPSRPAFLDSLPNTPAPRYRYRLMRFVQPAQKLAIYDGLQGEATRWFVDAPDFAASLQPLADNVVALVIQPRLSVDDDANAGAVAPAFEYDSRAGGSSGAQPPTQHQLPPVVEVVMVAIDERSALRLENGESKPGFHYSGLFEDSSRLDADLEAFTEDLTDRNLTYRVFRTVVPIRGSKWSSS